MIEWKSILKFNLDFQLRVGIMILVIKQIGKFLRICMLVFFFQKLENDNYE